MQTLSNELFVKDDEKRFISLLIRTVSPFDSDAMIKLRFYSSSQFESGGIRLKFTSSALPTYQLFGCSSDRNFDVFPDPTTTPELETGSFVWHVTYKKWSKQLTVTLNGVTVLSVQRSEEFCDRVEFSDSDTQWNSRRKVGIMFHEDDTASLSFKVCHVCFCKYLERIV